MIDYKKLGENIAKFRQNNDMSQEDLADLLFVSRETVSKWERGINHISIADLIKICKIFNITVNEIILGKEINKKNKEEISEITVEILKDNQKIRKRLIFSVIVIFVLLLLLLSYYFFNNYNSVKAYRVVSEDENFYLRDGLMVVFKDKMFIQVNGIENKNNVDVFFTELYYEKDGKKILIFETSTLGGSTSFSYEDTAIQYDDLDDIVSNLYLKITYNENQTSTMHLGTIQIYSNKSLFYRKTKPLEQDLSLLEKKIPDFVKENFEFIREDNCYRYETEKGDKKIRYTYFDIDIYIFEEFGQDYMEQYIYSLVGPEITYAKILSSGDIEEEFVCLLSTNECHRGNCDPEKIKYFQEEYLSKIE